MIKFAIFSLLSLCLFSSCATLSHYRQDPKLWNKKKGKDSKEKVVKQNAVTKTNELKKRKASAIKTPYTSQQLKESSTTSPTKQPGRVVRGFIEPDVTRLPNNNDLQESNISSPIPSQRSVDTPLAPLLNDPLVPLPNE